jgi:glycosyltransferase involved in cell wall biosynthesis
LNSKIDVVQISVVMATYKGELASNLKQAVDSILTQTLAPFEFVIVGDGPLPDDQLRVIDDAIAKAAFPVRFLQLDENVGRGRARNFGIACCTSEFIALMDSDDISLPNRLAVQAAFLQENSGVDVSATLTEEFDEDDHPGAAAIVKTCPESHEGIHKALRLSNCVANPTLLFRKAYWNQVGGFPDFREINEDYLFYFRLISAGAKFACLPVVLLRVRIGRQQRLRRKGIKILMSDVRFRLTVYREGHLGFFWTAFPLLLIAVRRMLPPYFEKSAQAVWRRFSHTIHK